MQTSGASSTFSPSLSSIVTVSVKSKFKCKDCRKKMVSLRSLRTRIVFAEKTISQLRVDMAEIENALSLKVCSVERYALGRSLVTIYYHCDNSDINIYYNVVLVQESTSHNCLCVVDMLISHVPVFRHL